MASQSLFRTSLSLPALSQLELPPALQATLCPSDIPLVLFPVRLETRFFTAPDGTSTELRVRVYPDKIHLDSHERDLTPSEQEWGKHYWTEVWRAGRGAKAHADAWRQLADRFGAPRAGWIVRVLRPVNIASRPDKPVPPGGPLPIQFPSVDVVTDGRDAAWRRAPQVRFMPDRWVAIVSSGGRPVQAVAGRDITEAVAAGPDPNADPAEIPGDQPAVDPGMLWMIDFDEAERKGMAVRVPIAPGTLANGIDSLFVLGVGASAQPAEISRALMRLLDAQHYTDGLEFLRAGTPTNNTAEGRAGYSTADPGHQRTFALDAAIDIEGLAADANARRLGAALGVPGGEIPHVLGRVGNAPDSHDRDLRAMNTALWQATWGYYLTNLIGFEGTPLTPEIVAWVRDHFVTHVRSGGPFAPIRCGKQPYGVLPVTSLDLWRPPAGEDAAYANDAWLKAFLIRVRDNIWRGRLTTEVARLGRRQADPDADLADVMRTEAVSSNYSARTMMGRHYFQHLRAFLGEDLVATGFISAQDALAAGILQRLGFTWRPRLARGTYADLSFRITAPLVQSGEISRWRPLEPNYIAALLSERRIDGLVAAARTDGTSLLHALLRHAMLLEYANAAASIGGSRDGASAPALMKDHELVDMVTGAPPTETWKRQLDVVVPAVTGQRTIREFLESLTTFTTTHVKALGEFRASLAHLQSRDSETLQYLLQGTLDLAAHRLDAWVTSFATKRLAAMRAVQPEGVFVGGYGWVENLRPAPAPAGAAPVTLPAGEDGPLVLQPADSGFIHAPSMAHAATAALLRNAHLGSSGTPQANGPFAIDLSSRRIREAKWLLDGVRAGQPLAALLGYRFERRLHDMRKDRFIGPCRELAPLSAGKLEQTPLPLESIAANNVVDGLLLHQKWIANAEAVKTHLAAAGASPTELTGLGRELDALGASIDGVSDALTAETAYQIVRGNVVRTATTLNAIATGDATAPELEIANTPRTGIALTHRVLLLCEAKGSSGNSVRAAADPVLNLWAARVMGDPRNVRCTVERIDDSGAVLETQTFPCGDLGLLQIDIVYGVDVQPRAGELSEIEQRVLYHARHRPGGFPADARLRIQHARPADLPSRQMTLLEMLEQARAVRRLLTGVRAADPEDLQPPERAASGTLDLPQLENRVVRAENAFRTAHRTLDALVKPVAAANAESLRTSLLGLAAFGVPSTVPVVAAGDDAAARSGLLMQATGVLKESKARVDRIATLAASPAAPDVRARRDQLLERLRAVFGASFVVMPLFKCGNAAELAGALGGSAQVQGGDALAVYTWFTRTERVRDAVARFAAPLRGAEVLNIGERLNLRVAQLPFDATDRWVGLPAEPGKTVPAGKVSLVVQSSGTIDPAQPLAGLIIDEWVEIVPSATETTAVTFQFNPPDACAPQAVLLAVPPVPGAPWTVADLHRVLIETLDMAKLRAVDSEAIGELAQYLPALFFAFNANDDAVSTDFAPLTRS